MGNNDSYLSLKGDVPVPETFQPPAMALAALDNLAFIMHTAVMMSGNALSWRQYKVGAAMVTYNFDSPALGMTTGANIKPAESGGPNICMPNR
jgi:hypothetical protein